MEEVLTAELQEDLVAFAQRTRELIGVLSICSGEGANPPDVEEIAPTAWRTQSQCCEIRPSLSMTPTSLRSTAAASHQAPG